MSRKLTVFSTAVALLLCSMNVAAEHAQLVIQQQLDPEVVEQIRERFGDEVLREFGHNTSVIKLDRTRWGELEDMLDQADLDYSVLDQRADYRQLFYTEPDTADLTPKQATMIDRLNNTPSVGQYNTVQLAPPSLRRVALEEGFDTRDGLPESDSFQLQLPGEQIAILKRDRIDRKTDENYTWYGTVLPDELGDLPEGEGEGEATLVVRGDNITGTVRRGKDVYSIRPLGGGLHAIIKRDFDKLPPEHPPDAQYQRSERRAAEPEDPEEADETAVEDMLDTPPDADATPADADADADVVSLVCPCTVTRIDVLVAYTQAADDAVVDIEGLVALAFEEANLSYQQSDVPVELNLTSTTQVDYDESNSGYITHRDRLVDTDDGELDDLHTLRDQESADIVVLFLDDGQYCGLAGDINADEDRAFALVYHECATGYYSFGHELGHLFGARHDVDTSDDPFEYGHGFSHDTDWRTIMAYSSGCSGCPRLNYWSSPDLVLDTVAMGDADTSHNARVLRETACRIAQFR